MTVIVAVATVEEYIVFDNAALAADNTVDVAGVVQDLTAEKTMM